MWLNKIKRKLIKWNEFITIPIGLLLTRWSEKIVTYFYPGSVRYDVGFYYDLIYSIGATFIIHGVAYGLFKLNWLFIEKYLDVDLEKDFKTLNPFQKIVISLWLFCVYLFSFIAMFWAVASSG